MSTRHFLVALVALAILLSGWTLVLSGAAAQAVHETDDARGTLWLEAEGTDSRRFTTFPPADEATETVNLRQSGLSHASVRWVMARPPADWSLQAGTEADVTVFLQDLDEALPVHDPQSPGAPGELELVVSLWSGDKSGSAAALGSAGTTWSFTDLPGGTVEVALTIPIDTAHTFKVNTSANDSAFELHIDIHGGRGDQGSPFDVLVGSEAHPSRLVVPGFPWATLRAAESIEREEEACRQRALQGEPCPEENTTGPADPDGRDAPMPVLPFLMGAAGALALVRRRADKPFKPASRTGTR